MQRTTPFLKHVLRVAMAGALIFGPASVQARVGESPVDCNLRYGGHERDTTTLDQIQRYPMIPGASERRYTYKGWNIAIAFADEAAAKLQYSKGPDAVKKTETDQLTDVEVISILKANLAPGLTWKQEIADPTVPRAEANPLEPAVYVKKWVRTDGIVAFLEDKGTKLTIQDTQAIADWQAAAARAKEQRQNLASVPEF